MSTENQTIIIKKKKRAAHGGHHGGSWKVAYADFVTAMMAFFLLMWLLGSVNHEDKRAIQDFFKNPSAVKAAGGASASMIKMGGTNDLSLRDGDSPVSMDDGEEGADSDESAIRDCKTDRSVDETDAKNSSDVNQVPISQFVSTAEDVEKRKDKERLEELMKELEKAIEEKSALSDFKDQLLLDITPEGLRIQIVDKQNRAMFDVGSAKLKLYTVDILFEIAKVINAVPNRVSITGHTDARPFISTDDYDNWELSSDRAHSARRALIDGGMEELKIGRVVGLGSSVLFDKKDPYADINRRISIIVMNKAWDKSLENVSGDN